MALAQGWLGITAVAMMAASGPGGLGGLYTEPAEGGVADVTVAGIPVHGMNPCEHEAIRSATVALDGARRVVVDAAAGSLRVEGRAGATEIAARGRACASDPDALRQVRLEVTRRGDAVVVEAIHPESGRVRRGRSTSMDLVVTVPEGLAAEIDDGSGSMKLSRLGTTRINDGSGDILADDIRGGMDIEDGSGGIRLTNVRGAVAIRDGSGNIELDGVRGAVGIRDGSGAITVRRAGSDVVIDDDGSGSISVAGVGGDFIVRDDGSGGISHRDVAGRVSLPRD